MLDGEAGDLGPGTRPRSDHRRKEVNCQTTDEQHTVLCLIPPSRPSVGPAAPAGPRTRSWPQPSFHPNFTVFRKHRPRILFWLAEPTHVTHWSHPIFPPRGSVPFSRWVVSDSATPWTAARQASLSITNSQSLLKLMSVELMMPSNHLILCERSESLLVSASLLRGGGLCLLPDYESGDFSKP